jgi:hypothetical protein
MTQDMKRWRGLTALIGAAIEHGATAIERVHMATAQRPFTVLSYIPVVSAPSAIVDKIHGATVAGVYESVRVITRLVALSLDAALDAIDGEVLDDPLPPLADELE